jgi:Mannosyl-glycoprotein endo-beta-N-acetylglucosaminidase
VPDISAQQAFIAEVAPAAVASQRKYGVPASVTIAQAIDESGWGRSSLATKDHNLFGIKGTGPAGSDQQPTQEYEHGHPVTRSASFRVYRNVAESVDDHGKLLATSEYYRRPMADRMDPNAFAAALTGIYATDPDYGAKLISLMRQYNLYRYDVARPAAVSHTAAPGDVTIPGLPQAAPAPQASTSPSAASRTATPGSAATATPGSSPSARPVPSQVATPGPSARAVPSPSPGLISARSWTATPGTFARPRPTPAPQSPARKITTRDTRTAARKYVPHLPPSVRSAFVTTARMPLMRQEFLYQDVASQIGIRWELLAACDWMQCEARPRFSPVHGEKLGTVTADGNVYHTKSAALEQCADDLAELAWAVYRIDLTAPDELSVGELANVFAAFRWGGLLKLHHTSAMEFPYSVAGLTVQHINMRWPNIADPNTPDKPGSRFRMPFGAVPVVLSLKYPASV